MAIARTAPSIRDKALPIAHPASQPALPTSKATIGRVTDNAFMESFFRSMKSEVVHGNTFNEGGQLLTVLRSYIPFTTAVECTRR